ncbi:MAG: pyridoxamine 5'-phosphate oxidase family protein [Pleurocapsa sp. SU_196_0]|nr:pyridoxamine 5'-phosphate oxidase family protein [Pleurocapsa sp. SU_196_0]
MELLEGNEGRQRFMELVKGVKFAMLTTQATDGSMRSRPMFTQDVEFDGELWFFTSASSGKVDEIEANPEVNVAYSKPDASLYLSVSGTARVCRTRRKSMSCGNRSSRCTSPTVPTILTWCC